MTHSRLVTLILLLFVLTSLALPSKGFINGRFVNQGSAGVFFSSELGDRGDYIEAEGGSCSISVSLHRRSEFWIEDSQSGRRVALKFDVYDDSPEKPNPVNKVVYDGREIELQHDSRIPESRSETEQFLLELLLALGFSAAACVIFSEGSVTDLVRFGLILQRRLAGSSAVTFRLSDIRGLIVGAVVFLRTACLIGLVSLPVIRWASLPKDLPVIIPCLCLCGGLGWALMDHLTSNSVIENLLEACLPDPPEPPK